MRLHPFILERHFAKYEFDVPFQLSCSDCEPYKQKELVEMASKETHQLWDELTLSYTESAGHPQLRQEIAGLYTGIEADEILTCIPEEGIFLAMNTLISKGDEVIVSSPAYQSLYEIARGIGGKVKEWRSENGLFNIEYLQSLLSPKTRMLILNFPHNPTGAHLSVNDFNQIIKWCEELNITLFSDEMYRGLEQQPDDRLPTAPAVWSGAISLSGMSKSFALPGLRIGWLVCRDKEVMQKLIILKDYTSICLSAPAEILSIIALQNHQAIWKRNLAIISKNIILVNDMVSRNPNTISWIPPKAGSVAYLYLKNGETSQNLCDRLLEEKQVLAIGSHLFNDPTPAIRLGLGRKDFGEALIRLEEGIGD